MLRIAMVVVVLVVVGLIILVKILPWWLSLLIFVSFVLMAPWLLRRLFSSIFLMPFKAKSRVLKDATVELHSIAPTAKPVDSIAAGEAVPPEEKSDSEGAQEQEVKILGPRNYFLLDVTITPRPSNGGFQHWEPGELRLVQKHTDCSNMNCEDESCEIDRIEVEENEKFQKDEGYKFAGPKRLRMWIAAEPSVRELKFQYYLEDFGAVQLPAS